MKPSQIAAVSAAAFSLSFIASERSLGQATDPVSPGGALSAYPTVVQTGTKPTLSWNILYPSVLGDLVTIIPPGTLRVNHQVLQAANHQALHATIQIIRAGENIGSPSPSGGGSGTTGSGTDGSGTTGSGTTGSSTDGSGTTGSSTTVSSTDGSGTTGSSTTGSSTTGSSTDGSGTTGSSTDGSGTTGSGTAGSTAGASFSTDLRISVDGGVYKQLFYGKQASVNPTKRLYIKKLSAGQKIDLGGRYVKPDGSWSDFFTTRSSNLQVVSLVNGSTPPTTFPLHLQATMTNSLKPYLDAAGKVKIGPLSVLVLMELNKTDRTNPGFDLQDQIALVTFSRKHPGNGNNGNGNNLDGVDSSNPGNGSGGPNGGVDPSGGYDDER